MAAGSELCVATVVVITCNDQPLSITEAGIKTPTSLYLLLAKR